MLPELLAKHHGLPNVWGEGAIFASSGLDGATSVASGFVATYARNRYGLLFHTPQRRFLDVELGARGTPRIATGESVLHYPMAGQRTRRSDGRKRGCSAIHGRKLPGD